VGELEGILTRMISRDDLKSLIDRVPEDGLGDVFSLANFLVSPPQLNPEHERTRQRTEQYREVVQRRFREDREPGAIAEDSPIGGTGNSGAHKGISFERHSYDYWDEGTLVQHISILRWPRGRDYREILDLSRSH
jgi:hypothetical protein